jgi:hypothetical protein
MVEQMSRFEGVDGCGHSDDIFWYNCKLCPKLAVKFIWYARIG